jgi:hypothetical protein
MSEVIDLENGRQERPRIGTGQPSKSALRTVEEPP